MLPDEVDKLLGSYHSLQARAAHLRSEVELQKRALDYERGHSIEGDAMHALNLDGMPHGNLPGNPTESLVLRYASGYEPQYIRTMADDIRRTEDELFETQLAVERVEGWLICLGERERFIIQAHVLDGVPWRQVLDDFEEKYGPTSKESLKRIKREALAKIYTVAR